MKKLITLLILFFITTIYADTYETEVSGKMIKIPGGKFIMGDCFNEGQPDELPTREVKISPFYIAIYEMTNKRFVKFLNSTKTNKNGILNGKKIIYFGDDREYNIYYDNGFKIESGKENNPVINVTWYGAVLYCNWASKQDGLEQCYNNNFKCNLTKNGYRLLTEAEFEYVASASFTGKKYRYIWGNENPTNDMLNFNMQFNHTTPVGTYKPFYGLYDIAGNVWEWCNDWYANYPENPQTDPIYQESGQVKIVKGGCRYVGNSYIRACYRGWSEPDYSYDNYGFRLAKSIR